MTRKVTGAAYMLAMTSAAGRRPVDRDVIRYLPPCLVALMDCTRLGWTDYSPHVSDQATLRRLLKLNLDSAFRYYWNGWIKLRRHGDLRFAAWTMQDRLAQKASKIAHLASMPFKVICSATPKLLSARYFHGGTHFAIQLSTYLTISVLICRRTLQNCLRRPPSWSRALVAPRPTQPGHQS
jgi:hypothetical protein